MKKDTILPEVVQPLYRHNKGIIKDNAVKALLADNLFRQRIERNHKGKGSYRRKAKHSGGWLEKPDYKTFANRTFIIGFFLKKMRGYYV